MKLKFPYVVRVCETCRSEFIFQPIPSAVRRGRGRFCSSGCAHIVPLADRFFSKIGAKSSGGCILWNGHVKDNGYGDIHERHAGRLLSAHRVAYDLMVGPIPEGMCVLHRCDNPPCINPTHLFLGTQLDNIADMVAKGRQSRGSGKGANVKLDDNIVRDVRRRIASGDSNTAIGRDLGVSHVTISDIRTGRTWSHVGDIV